MSHDDLLDAIDSMPLLGALTRGAFDLGKRYEFDAAIEAMHRRNRDEAVERDRVHRGAVCENHDLGDEDRR